MVEMSSEAARMWAQLLRGWRKVRVSSACTAGRGFCPAVYWYLLRVAAGGVAWCLGVCCPRSLWFDSIAACSCPPRPLLSEEEEEGMEKQLCWDTPCTAPCACACFDRSGCFSLLLPPSTRNPHRVKSRELFDPSENCHPAPSSG